MASKVFILLLLGFGGLSEALRCFQCDGPDDECTGQNEIEVECSPTSDGCWIRKYIGILEKTCGKRNELFDCVQEKLGQSGVCFRGTVSDVVKYMGECSNEGLISDGQLDIKSMMHKVQDNNTIVSQAYGHQARQEDMYALCICTTDLCNTEELADGDNESSSPLPTNPTTGVTPPTTTTPTTTPTTTLSTTPTTTTPTTTRSTTPTTTTTSTTTSTTTTSTTTPPTTICPTSPATTDGTSSTGTTGDASSTSTTGDASSTTSACDPSATTEGDDEDSGTVGHMVNAGTLIASVAILIMSNRLLY